MKLKFFVLGILLWFTALIPSSASAEGIGYRILAFKTATGATKTDENWKTCGNYFAETETMNGKMVHFTYGKGSFKNLTTVYIFAMIELVVVSINENVSAPMVMVQDDGSSTKFFLMMNVTDYRAGLPCLGKGEKI